MLAVLTIPLVGFVGAGLVTHVEMCACGMPNDQCHCDMIARSVEKGDACGVADAEGSFCSMKRNRPMPLPERNLANLDLRWVPVEGPERRVDATLSASGLVAEAAPTASDPLLDPPEPPPPRSA